MSTALEASSDRRKMMSATPVATEYHNSDG
jgi:hypothetical protein